MWQTLAWEHAVALNLAMAARADTATSSIATKLDEPTEFRLTPMCGLFPVGKLVLQKSLQNQLAFRGACKHATLCGHARSPVDADMVVAGLQPVAG